MTAYELPERAVRPLAAFLIGKPLSPEYPAGGEVTVVARELLDEPVRIAVAEELRAQANQIMKNVDQVAGDPDEGIYLDAASTHAHMLRKRADALDPEGATR